MSTINSALSGLRVAQQRLAVSADNVANQRTTTAEKDGKLINAPYEPKQVQALAQEPGGVLGRVLPVPQGTLARYDPDSPVAAEDGIIQEPNVQLEREAVEQVLSAHAFKANLKTLKAENDILGSLLDMKE